MVQPSPTHLIESCAKFSPLRVVDKAGELRRISFFFVCMTTVGYHTTALLILYFPAALPLPVVFGINQSIKHTTVGRHGKPIVLPGANVNVAPATPAWFTAPVRFAQDINQRLARIESLDQRHDRTSPIGLGKGRSAPSPSPAPGGAGGGKSAAEGSTQGGTSFSAAADVTVDHSSSARPSGTARVSRQMCEGSTRGLNGDDAGTGGFSISTAVQRRENNNGVGQSVRDGDREDVDRARAQATTEVWGKERVAGPLGFFYLGLTPTSWNWAAVQSK